MRTQKIIWTVEQATDLSDSNLNQIHFTHPVFPSITLITKTHEMEKDLKM